MKKILAVLGFWLLSAPAFAGVSCTLPFNLTNGTLADATQVMANYNALVSCLGNAAAAGANTDITSLNGLTTPLSPVQGGSSVYVGGSSGGSANVQTITTVPTVIHAAGNTLIFRAGFSNTGPLTVNGINVYRLSQLGATMSVGGELIAGQMVSLLDDGTEYQCTSCGIASISESRDFTGQSIPPGWLVEDGTCISQTTYADLFAVFGSTDLWTPGSTGGSCSAGNFHLPFANGSASFAYDTQQNVTGPVTANKLTSAGSGCNAIGPGISCGSQNQTIAQANLPAVNLPVSSITATNSSTVNIWYQTNGGTVFPTGGGNEAANQGAGNITTTLGGHVPLGGSGTPLTTIPSLFTVIKAIKF